MDLQALLDRRASTWDAMTKILDDATAAKRELSGEETEKYNKLEGDLDADSGRIDLLERNAKLARTMSKVEADPIVNPGGGTPAGGVESEERYAKAFNRFLRFGMEDLDSDDRRLVRSGFQADPEMRAQAVGTNTAGGFLVPQGFRDKLIEVMKAFGNVQGVSEVLTTETGNVLPWPTNDDTGNEGALLAENTQDTELDLTLGTNQLGAYKYTSKITRASLEFIQDAAVDVETWIPRKHGERLGRITNRHFTVGTGTAQPQGIVTGATVGVTAATGGTTAVTLDNLIDLQHSIDPAYRNERAAFMFADTVLQATRKIKDTTGQYIWQPAVTAGAQPTLLGSPYIINQHMAVPAASAKSVLYGDFQAGYVVRIVRAIQAVRFNERYMDFFQVGFVSFLRADGRVQDTNAYKAFQQSAT